MAITRSLSNGNKLVDYTEEINEMDNTYGVLNGMGLFQGQGIAMEAVIFDKNMQEATLLPQVSRRGGEHSKGKDRSRETFSIALPYFNHQDYVTPQDLQGIRQTGTPEGARALARAIADKSEDMRVSADQTREYMKIQAIKGKTTDAEGNDIADMFSIFNVSQMEVDFELGSASTNIDQKISEVKRLLAKNLKSGGRIGGIQIMVSPEFFDKLVSHPKLREAYLYYQASPQSDVVRANLAVFETWGVTDTFVHKGVTFWTYDAEFTDPEGITRRALNTDPAVEGGYTLVSGVRDLYRGYFGPANTLEGANAVGDEMNLYEFRDPKGKFHELELEMSPLYFMTRPLMSLKVVSSN